MRQKPGQQCINKGMMWAIRAGALTFFLLFWHQSQNSKFKYQNVIFWSSLIFITPLLGLIEHRLFDPPTAMPLLMAAIWGMVAALGNWCLKQSGSKSSPNAPWFLISKPLFSVITLCLLLGSIIFYCLNEAGP